MGNDQKTKNDIRVMRLDPNLEKNLERLYNERGFELEDAEHAHFRARGPGMVATYYKSGKLVLQGVDVDREKQMVEELIGRNTGGEQTRRSVTAVSKTLKGRAIEAGVPTIGTDESGKGDFFGPLVVAAVILKEKEGRLLQKKGLQDGKQLTAVQLISLAGQIKYRCRYSLLTLPPVRYNLLYKKYRNLNRLLAWAHARAIKSLSHLGIKQAVTDQFGDKSLVREELGRADVQIQLEQTPRAERYPAVAAASVLARNRFQERLRELSWKHDLELPPGGGVKTETAAVKVLRRGGWELLSQVAKLHFANAERAWSQLEMGTQG